MARFDVHRNQRSGTSFPFLLDVQANLLSDLRTRLVIPLLPAGLAPRARGHLNPEVKVAGEPFRLQTEIIGPVAVSQLGELVASLEQQRDEIVAAIDFLLQGF
jgi:toxin CcdB